MHADRKSTSGGAIRTQGTTVVSFARTQSMLTHSSAQADIIAIGTALTEAKALQNILIESNMCDTVNIRVHCDASTAIAIAKKYGCTTKT